MISDNLMSKITGNDDCLSQQLLRVNMYKVHLLDLLVCGGVICISISLYGKYPLLF
jgi:hypothetical protein